MGLTDTVYGEHCRQLSTVRGTRRRRTPHTRPARRKTDVVGNGGLRALRLAAWRKAWLSGTVREAERHLLDGNRQLTHQELRGFVIDFGPEAIGARRQRPCHRRVKLARGAGQNAQPVRIERLLGDDLALNAQQVAGVKAERWRILVGDDALEIDKRVRQSPEAAYEDDFFADFANAVGWKVGR